MFIILMVPSHRSIYFGRSRSICLVDEEMMLKVVRVIDSVVEEIPWPVLRMVWLGMGTPYYSMRHLQLTR
jgi:hypothetical protein